MYKCKYFTDDEFSRIPSAEGNDIQEVLKIKLDLAREISNVPYKITSAYRTEITNKKCGGLSNSSHLKGLAVDIYNDYTNKGKTARILYGLIKAGFSRIGIAKDFIHVDCDESKPDAIWDYN